MREQAMLLNMGGPKSTGVAALIRGKYILCAFLVGVIAGRDGGHKSLEFHTQCGTDMPQAAVTTGTDYPFRPTVWDVHSGYLQLSTENQPLRTSFKAFSGSLSGVPSSERP